MPTRIWLARGDEPDVAAQTSAGEFSLHAGPFAVRTPITITGDLLSASCRATPAFRQSVRAAASDIRSIADMRPHA